MNDNITNGNTNDDADELIIDKGNINERTIGILVLLTVPLAWGTYTPVVKYMYEKISMPGFVFSAGYYLVAAASLGVLSYLQDGAREEIQTNDDESDVSITTRGGWELGSYLFVGNGLQVVGLQTVPADRAAFLVQLTTVMVPILFAVTEGKLSAVPLQIWIACIIAFIGVVVMGADDGGGSSSISDGINAIKSALSTGVADHHYSADGAPFALGDNNMNQLSSMQLSQGDLLIVLAAISYTMHVVRLGAYAPRTTPLKLAASKAKTEAILSVVLVIGLTFIGSTHFPSPEFVSQTGNSVSEYFQTTISEFTEGGLASNQSSLGVSVGAILWTGWVTCAYTIYAQSFGQSRVNPTDSNLIYTTQPLFSSMFAYILLGETLGFYGFVGALLIGVALWLVPFSDGDS
ncbi:hypothetical protein ACHAXR_002364 [Thalassiosira sp. AJA248-18]